MLRSIKNWKDKRDAKILAQLDDYSPSHDQTFVWPTKLFSIESPPWWAWVGLGIVAGIAVHHFITFN